MTAAFTRRRLAWLVWALSSTFLVGSVVLDPSLELFVTMLPAAALATVGALVALRRPSNAIGWIFSTAGFLIAASNVTSGYAHRALFADHSSLPGGEYAAWLSVELWPAAFFFGIYLLLLFPNGRLPSRRWLPVAWVPAVGLVALCVGSLAPGLLDDDPQFEEIQNPVGIDGGESLLAPFGWAVWLTLIPGLLLGALALVLRFRRSHGEERQQLKWIAVAAALFGLAWFASAASWGTSSQAAQDATGALALVAVTGLPVAAALAIFKYRLYDIDLIIRRTLVYGLLTAGLAGLYFGIVLALQQVFSSFAGGSDLAIAGSTLAVAALFGPARRRIQAAVDRRFYRRRYNAQRTLEIFSARLRDEIDLAALGGELRGVIQETMQPAHLSLWLRTPESP
jgi:hypothetical protein